MEELNAAPEARPAQRRRVRFLYDVETNGFLNKTTTIHSLVLWDLDTQELLSFRNDGHPDNAARMEAAVRMLDAAEFRAGHNIIKFDEPALAKVYPFFRPNRSGVVFDTLIATRLLWPNIAEGDKYRLKRGTITGRLIGSHSLEAWGQRLGLWKGDYAKVREGLLKTHNEQAGLPPPTTDEISEYVWGVWNQDMQDYCDQDVIVTAKLYARIQQREYSQRAYDDEMAIAVLCQKIEANGYPFDMTGAGVLYAELAGARARLETKLRETFGSWVSPLGEARKPGSSNSQTGLWGESCWVFIDSGEPLEYFDLTPKGQPSASARRRGVRRVFTGYEYTPIKITSFNPSSRYHIAERLTALYGWAPTEFTPSGEPKVDEEVLNGLAFPPIPLLVEYFTVIKRLGQLAEGKQAWLNHCDKGNIHGAYNTVGAVTRRATHSSPNIAQVPSVTIGEKVDPETGQKTKAILLGYAGGWGHECRSLFGVPAGWWQVGTDASGLELRCLAHYMGRWDGGAYAKVLLEGDVHTENQRAAGLPTRSDAKTFIYAFLYGAGDGKIGSIIGGDATAGAALRKKFMEGLPALGNLVAAVKKKAKATKELAALDGGVLHVRSDHAALNTLLQSAGALICKKWGVLIEAELLRRGYRHGWDGDFAFMAWVHDEYQIAARTQELAHEIGEISMWAIREVERAFGFRCPLAAEYKIGLNWSECH